MCSTHHNMYYYHVDVPGPDEEDVGQDDQTEHLVQSLSAPLVHPGGGVSNRNADYAGCEKTKIKSYIFQNKK